MDIARIDNSKTINDIKRKRGRILEKPKTNSLGNMVGY